MKVTAIVLVTTDDDTLLIKPVRVVGFGKASEVTKLGETIEAFLRGHGMRPEAKPRRRPIRELKCLIIGGEVQL